MPNINNMVVDNFSLLKGLSEDKSQILLNYVPDPCIIFADTTMINTVLRNLLSNAIKFTPKKGIISISASQTDEFVEISVTDSGLGISENRIETLFSLDSKTNTLGTEKESGTGLGLLLCKELVEKNGGRIWVESHVGKGSTFRFTVPVRYN